MKKLYFILLCCICYSVGHAQATSYGNLQAAGTTAGIGGTNTNSFFGHQAGLNTTDSFNTFLGAQSGYDNTVGRFNSFLGYRAGYNNITGERNTFIGMQSGYFNNAGSDNIFLGHQSGLGNVNGNFNTFIGIQSGNEASGDNNTFFGYQTGYLAEGSGNVFLGYRAGYNEIAGSDLLYIDNSDTSDPLIWGDFANDLLRFNGDVRITSIPQDDALNRILVSDTDGNVRWRDALSLGGGGAQRTDEEIRDVAGAMVSGNTETLIDVTYDDANDILNFAVENNLSQYNNDAGFIADTDININFPSFPESAGDVGGNTNSFFGHEAGFSNTATNNTFMGHQSGSSNTGGADNVFLGYQSGLLNNSGNSNIFVGSRSGRNNSIGSNNTHMGHQSGFNAVGSGNVLLGYQAGYNEGGNDMLYIANSNTANPLIWGDFANSMLRFNGSVQITDIAQDDALSRVLVSDNAGNLSWRDAPTLDTNTQRTDEEIRDTSGAMVSGNTETLIDVTYDDANDIMNFEVENDLSQYDNTTSGFITNPDDADADPVNEIQDLSLAGNILSLSADVSPVDLSGYLDDTTRSDEDIRDASGAMVSGNTETLIAVTYDDTNDIMNFEVENDLSQYDNSVSAFITNADDADADPVNELQNLSYDSATRIISIDQGGSSADISSINTFPSFPYSAGDNGGNTNAFFGHEAGLANTGVNNTLMGYQSGFNNTTGIGNTAGGYQALYNNTSAGRNIGIGSGALYSQSYDNGGMAWQSNNVAIGFEALYSNQPTSVGNGINNTAVGGRTLYNNTTGNRNTANGNQALYSNTTGSNNTGTGYWALYSNTTGIWNTAKGAYALQDNTTGQYNTAHGASALIGNSTGNRNTGVGTDALYANTTGNNNTALGYNASPNATDYTNTTALGNEATPTASNQVRLGDASVTSIGGVVAWAILSDGRFKKNVEENIPGLEFISQLRPVSYELNKSKLNKFLKKESPEGEKPTETKPQRRSIGFVAQEVEDVLQAKGYTQIGIETPQNEGDHYSIRYSEFVVPLVKGMQEQQQMIQEQQALIERMQEEIALLKNQNSGAAGGFPTDNQVKSAEGFVLYQNVPNPFDKTTTIEAVVPEGTQQAQLVIYNLQGLELASYTIDQRGKTSVAISGGILPSGMYLYALVVDGQLIDTKKMILTR